MGEAKVVSRKAAVGTAAFCVMLLIGLVGAVVNYTAALNGKDAAISDMTLQLEEKSSQIDGLQASINASQSEIDGLTSQILQLNASISELNERVSQKDGQISSLDSQISQKEARIADLNDQISDLQVQKSDLLSQIASLNSQIADLENHLSLNVGTTLETYYHYVRLNCVTLGLEPVDETQWWMYPDYVEVSVAFAADLAAHDIGNLYWPTLEADSNYYYYAGEYSYETSSRIMDEAMSMVNVSVSDSSTVKIDKVLAFIYQNVFYENRLLDHMWFPCETLTFRSGDCTAFSILAASMFEDAGIKSAVGFFSNSSLGGHAMVLVRLDDLGLYDYWYYGDLTSYGLASGKWIIIEPQFGSISEQAANLNWIGYWDLDACAEVPYGS